MKKFLIVLIGFLCLGLGPKTEWWITFYEDENTTHKCTRDKFNEMHEYFEVNEFRVDYINYLTWEQKGKFENHVSN